MKLNRKNKLLIFGVLVTLYICYAFAFSNTYTYYKEFESQKELVSSNLNTPEVLAQLVQKEKQLDTLLSQYNAASGNSFQNELLKNLSGLSQKHNLQITDFREPHADTEKEVICYTYVFSVQGSFNGIMLMANSIENNPALGSIEHIAFEKRKNYKNNTDYLVAEVILQKNENVKANK
jgi:hypothetical protein